MASSRHLLTLAWVGLLAAAGARSAVAAPAISSDQAPLAAIAGLREEVRKADAALMPLVDERRRLEAEAARLAGEIDAQKRKGQGVRRDLDLGSLLAASKATTDALERVQGELRWREPGITELRRRLARTLDAALAPGGARLGDAARADLAQLRGATLALLPSGAQPLQIAQGRDATAADPLDGPRELRYKADLLRDSGDKLRREARRIGTRIDDAERRRRLRERAGALDEDMFGESTSNRRIARTQATASAAGDNAHAGETASKGAADPQAPNTSLGSPSPAPNTPTTPTGTPNNGGRNDTTTGAPAATPSTTPTRNTESTVLRNLVDPATLDELRRADAIDDVDRQTRALKKAQGELEALAAELDRRARTLEGRADELKRQK